MPSATALCTFTRRTCLLRAPFGVARSPRSAALAAFGTLSASSLLPVSPPLSAAFATASMPATSTTLPIARIAFSAFLTFVATTRYRRDTRAAFARFRGLQCALGAVLRTACYLRGSFWVSILRDRVFGRTLFFKIFVFLAVAVGVFQLVITEHLFHFVGAFR